MEPWRGAEHEEGPDHRQTRALSLDESEEFFTAEERRGKGIPAEVTPRAKAWKWDSVTEWGAASREARWTMGYGTSSGP